METVTAIEAAGVDITSAVPSDDEPGGEAALVAHAKRDPEAFALLYRRYAGPVYWYAFRRLGDRDLADDATSRTFEKALTAIGTCRADRFRAWLFTLARNTVTDLLRERRPTVGLEQAATIPDARAGPAEAAQAEETQRRVGALLTRLPDGQRQIVELRLAGLTGAEIARVLGRSHVAIRVGQLRAYGRLRQILEENPEALDGTP